MTTDIITLEIVFDSGYGEIANVPARFNIDSEATAELIDVRLQGLILNRDQLVAWTSEVEVEPVEADADLRAIEDGYIDAPHNWQDDERRAYQEGTGFPFGCVMLRSVKYIKTKVSARQRSRTSNLAASAGASYSDTGTAHGPVSAAGGQLHSHAAARLIRGAAALLFAALLTFGMGHTATKAVANLAHDMQPKGW